MVRKKVEQIPRGADEREDDDAKGLGSRCQWKSPQAKALIPEELGVASGVAKMLMVSTYVSRALEHWRPTRRHPQTAQQDRHPIVEPMIRAEIEMCPFVH